MIDLFILSPALSCLDVLAMAMAWNATVAALVTACAMNSFWLICVACHFYLFSCIHAIVYECLMTLPFCSHLFFAETT